MCTGQPGVCTGQPDKLRHDCIAHGSCFITVWTQNYRTIQEQECFSQSSNKFQKILCHTKNMGKEEKGHFGRKSGLARTAVCVNGYSAKKCYSQLCCYWGELWKQFLPKGPIKVLATVDISLHIGIYLSVYTRNFNVPFSNLECRFFF